MYSFSECLLLVASLLLHNANIAAGRIALSDTETSIKVEKCGKPEFQSIQDIPLDGNIPLSPRGPYKTSGGPIQGKLNVHVVPHTHDDVGWLKTVDQYFYGRNSSIQNAAVQFIIDTVVLALEENPDRKFIYVEIAFFKRWWDEQSPAKQASVKRLVVNGQLEFINGGWCMSDEAAPFYVDMVDQQTLGHLFLKEHFGEKAAPRAGWQIDPFGHSNFMATAYALMGMDSWFFGRIDYQDRAKRENQTTLEMVMHPSASLGSSVDIFTGVTRGYGFPSGFCWEHNQDDPICDDPRMEEINVKSRVDDFVSAALEQAEHYANKDGNIMFTMGEDFCYENAFPWFVNMDKLIHYVNLDGRVNAFYSTPSMYTDAKHAANVTWTTKTDDWFPYCDGSATYDPSTARIDTNDGHAQWTGYFTSRAALKRNVRAASSLLQSCRQLGLLQHAHASKDAWCPPPFEAAVAGSSLWEGLGLAQHHDAVSGTSKQHVADDYAVHLQRGSDACQASMAGALEQLSGAGQLVYCPKLNESICEATTLWTEGNISVVVYNPLGQERVEFLRIPIGASGGVSVIDATTFQCVEAQIVAESTGGRTLAVEAALPATGYSVYTLVAGAGPQCRAADTSERRLVSPSGSNSIQNAMLRVVVDPATNQLAALENKKIGKTVRMTQWWGYYIASDGHHQEARERLGQASGAYIFRPACAEGDVEPCLPTSVAESGSGNSSRPNTTILE
ncbi:hypothetical protein CYMTET_16415, partial [Cymbomonas tetramitiformis]